MTIAKDDIDNLKSIKILAHKARQAVNRLSSNIYEGICLANSETPTIPYIGAKINNLGDIALFQAIQSLLPTYRLVFFDKSSIQQFSIAQALGWQARYFCVGGGTLINAAPTLSSAKWFTERGMHMFTFGTGVHDPVFWNYIGGFPNVLNDWIELLTQVEYLTVRGPLSAQILESHGLSNVKIIGDPALQFWCPGNELKIPSRRIAVNIGLSKGRFWGKDENRILQLLFKVAKRLIADGFEIIVVSVWDHDHNIAREFVRELDSSMVRIELADQDVDSFLKVVSQCDLLISIKLHAAILAMCRSIPVVSIEYQPKCRDFMLSMELEQYNIRTDKLDTDILLNLVYKTLSDTQEIRRKIDHKIAGYIEKQKLYAQDIAKCLYTNC